MLMSARLGEVVGRASTTIRTCRWPLAMSVALVLSACTRQMPEFPPVAAGQRIGAPGAELRDVEGNVYKTIRIGAQWWMAENYRLQRTPDKRPLSSFVYDDDPERYGRYGRLYPWDVAMNGATKEDARGICPEGWHVPSDADWRTLIGHLDGESVAGRKLLPGQASGFDAYPSGGADYTGRYVYFGEEAMFWSSTMTEMGRANHWGINIDGRLIVFAARQAARVAVRCVQDSAAAR